MDSYKTNNDMKKTNIKLERGGLIRTFTQDNKIEYELYIVDVIGEIIFTKAFIKFPIIPKGGDYNTVPIQCWDIRDILFVKKNIEILTKKERENQREKEINQSTE